MSLHRIIYASRAVKPLDDDEIEHLLRKARMDNMALDITGYLIHDSCGFFQVLEGPAEAVAQVFQRIRKDERHCQLDLIQSTSIDSRQFGDWSMGFMDARELGSESSATFQNTESCMNWTALEPDEALDFMRLLSARQPHGTTQDQAC